MRIMRNRNSLIAASVATVTTLNCSSLISSLLIILSLLQQYQYIEGRALTNSSTVSSSSSRFTTIESNSIQREIVEKQTNRDFSRSLKRVFLSNRTITCNDGSQSGFYLRKSTGSKKWVVFLEGGWHCFDVKSCRARWLKLRHLMTSAQWPETRDVGGILSSQPDENPYWYNANHVLVPYCSSDSWSGTKSQSDNWRFMGSLIIRQVIADLIPLGLGQTPSELLLVGSSAGGLGVMLNLDRIHNFLFNEKHLKVLVRGVSDSGWFLDREPYTPGAIAASESVRQGWKMWEGSLPEDCVKQHSAEPWRCYYGYRLYPTLKSPLFVFQWLFDEAQMRADNVGAPVTPQQWNYIHDMGGALRQSLDNVTGVFAPSCIGHAVLSKRDWLNIKIDDISLPEALRCWEQLTQSKHNKLHRNSFQPTRNDRKHRYNQKQRHANKNQNKKVARKHNSNRNGGNGGVDTNRSDGQRGHRKLTREEREHRRRHNEKKRNHRRLMQQQQRAQGNDGGINKSPLDQSNNRHRKKKNLGNLIVTQNDSENDGNRKHRKNLALNRTRKLNQHAKLPNNKPENGGGGNGKDKHKHKRRKNQMQQQQKNQHNQQHRRQYQREQEDQRFHNRNQQQSAAATTTTLQDFSKTTSEPNKCSLRLLERCSWPQCNHSCPTLTNPLTGEEMRFLELLASFGLDIEAVATALGVDMQTLKNMDQTELVNLLTQQVS